MKDGDKRGEKYQKDIQTHKSKINATAIKEKERQTNKSTQNTT